MMKGLKGVRFDGIHSFKHLNLVLSSVDISPPEAKTNYVDVPGADGLLDISEALGEIKYNNRTITLVFSTLPGDDLMKKQSEVYNALHGKRFEKIILEKDSFWYWTGRASVTGVKDTYPISEISVSISVEPWKRKVNKTVIEAELSTVYKKIIISNSRKRVMPRVVAPSGGTVFIKQGNNVFEFNDNTAYNLNFKLCEGLNTLEINGVTIPVQGVTPTAIIEYRECNL